MRKTCAFCRFFVLQGVVAFPSAHGTCRRHAPRGPATAEGSGWSAFPPVGVNNWCGEQEEIRQASPTAAKRVRELQSWLNGERP